MMYRVTARLKSALAPEYLSKLTDGTISAQRPDGREIVAAMDAAVMTEDGRVKWSQACFCSTPLAHERATVFDTYFDEMRIEPVGQRETYTGEAFMAHLAELGNKTQERP